MVSNEILAASPSAFYPSETDILKKGKTRIVSEVIIYRGEVAPRKLWIAIVLSLLMPGLGHLYTGHANRGVSAYLAWLGIAGLVTAFTLIADLFFLRSVLALGIFYIYLEIWLTSDLIRVVRRYGTPYVLQSYNHPLVYVSAVIILYLVPAFSTYEYASRILVGSHQVEDINMYPMLVPGDRVFFERSGTFDRPIRRGDLVICKFSEDNHSVLRVAGLPGDTIHVANDGAVMVNEKALHRQLLGEVAWSDPSIEFESYDKLLGYLEYGETEPYQVFYSTSVQLMETDRTNLAKNMFFLLSDNRTDHHVIDSRRLGPISGGRIVGRPLYVWYSSTAQINETRFRRLGLSLE